MKLRISISLSLLLLFLTLAIPVAAAGHELTIKVPVSYKSVTGEPVQMVLRGLNESEHDRNVEMPGSGTYQFDLTFNQPGTYWYILSVTDGNVTGVRYDQTEYNVIITIAENVEGRVMKGDVVVARIGSLNKSTSASFEDTWEDGHDPNRSNDATPTPSPLSPSDQPTKTDSNATTPPPDANHPKDAGNGDSKRSTNPSDKDGSGNKTQLSDNKSDHSNRNTSKTLNGSAIRQILAQALPKTGDAAPALTVAAVMVLSFVCIIVILVRRKVRQYDER